MNKLSFTLFSAFLAGGSVLSLTAQAQNMPSAASQEVAVFGEAESANGTENVMFLEQQNDNENPLGNPIVETPSASSTAPSSMTPDASTPTVDVAPTPAAVPSNVVSESEPQDPSISQEPNPAQVNNQIQNTLYESGGRIYDVQSYPDTDVERIQAEPQPTITDYPTY